MNITVTQTLLQNYRYDGATATVRVYSNQTFITSDSETIMEGHHRDDQGWYKSISCTVSSNVLTIPSFTIDSTSDSNNQRATYTFVLYDADGRRRDVLLGDARVPHTIGSTITWEQIIIYSSAFKRPYTTYYSAEQINALILATATTLQPLDADLTAIAALNSAANTMPYATGAQAWALTTLTAFARTLLDDADAATARATLVAQETLVSGTNIKTVNGETLLGSGDVSITALTEETVIYRSSYASLALAITAADEKELCLTTSDTVSASTSVPQDVKLSIRGDGIFSIDSGQTLTINSLLDPGDRKLNNGKGTLVVLNQPFVRQSWWTGTYAGNSYTTEDVDSSETAIDVADATKFGPAPFPISIDSEAMWCTGVAGNTLTVERGYDSTSAVTHTGSTTLAEAITNTTGTEWDVVDATQLNPVPCLILVDSELMEVTSVSGNTITVSRGVESTTPATHSNGATVSRRQRVYPYISSVMWNGMLSSASTNQALKVFVGPGRWTTKGGVALNSAMTFVGAGGLPDAGGGSVYQLITDSSYIFKIGNTKYHIGFEDLGFDLEFCDSSTAVDISGAAGEFMLNGYFRRCRFHRGDYGVRAYDSGAAATFMALNLYFEHCEFAYQLIANYGSGTVNGSWQFNQCNFTPGATANTAGTAVCGDHNYSGPAVHINCTYNGQTPVSPQTYHTMLASNGINTTSNLITVSADHELETSKIYKCYLFDRETISSTVVAAAGITTSGDARCVVTSSLISGSPVTVTVPVTTGSHTTATLIAQAIQTAVNANAAISAVATMYRDGAKLYLRKNNHRDRESAFNFTIEDVTSVGITDDTASDKEWGFGLPPATLTINRTTTIDEIDLDREAIWFVPENSTTGYAYMHPHWSQLGTPSDYRLNFTPQTTTLAEDLDNSETAIDVASATALVGVLGSNIIVDSEEMTVTAIDGNTLTVTRGANFTSAATHTNGATVTRVMASINVVNATTLNGGIDSSVTSVEVASASLLSGIARSNIRVDNEEMFVTAISGTTLTVVRGANGTTPASHSTGATVYRLNPTLQLRTNQPVREGKPLAVFRIRNTMTPIIVIGGQDEAIPYWAVIESTFEKQKAFIMEGCMIQSQLLLKSKCIVQTKNCWLPLDWATDEWGVEAEYISENDQPFHDVVIGGYKDLGNTIHSTEKMSIGAFCSYSKLHKENIVDQYWTKHYIPHQFNLDRNTNTIDKPLVELVRPRNLSEKVWMRIGGREDHQKNSQSLTSYHDIIFLDPDVTLGLQYSFMEYWLEIRSKSNQLGTMNDGRYFSGHVAHKGRLINTNSKLLVPAAGVVTFYGDEGPIYYTDVLAADTTFNVGTAAGRNFLGYDESIKIIIPVDTTNRLVSWGNGFYVEGPRNFNTGTLGNYWVCKFTAFGGNQLLQDGPFQLVGTSATLRSSGTDRWQYPSSTSITAFTGAHYLVNDGSLTTITLPAEANMNIGEYFKVNGYGSGGWRIAQNASQVIVMNSGGVAGVNQTTTGTSGRVDSTDAYDCVTIQKVASNTYALRVHQGNPTLT